MSDAESSERWKSSTVQDSHENLCFELNKLLKTSPHEEYKSWQEEFEGFKTIFRKYLTSKPQISWNKIRPLPEGAIRNYDSLPKPEFEKIQKLLEKLVVVKLNGGLGTSMGCKGSKSLIVVREDLTFLDLTMQQLENLNNQYEVEVPLVFMNSFNTDDDTKKVLRKYKKVGVKNSTFNQSRYPRIDAETLLPVITDLSMNSNEFWYPPGHGDFYHAFAKSGMLDKFIAEGKEYCFVSNVDNLGALVDVNILNFIQKSNSEFVMEVTDKTRADVKGGTLIEYDEKLMLLELAQVPKGYEDDFMSMSKFKIFNTNNLWCNLRSIDRLVKNGKLDLEIIVNPKHLSNLNVDVLQLETAAGAAIKCFNEAVGINVPRSRFLPVKKTQDLLLIMSNVYELSNGVLRRNAKRSVPLLPLVKLGPSFDRIEEFKRRFRGIPDILELDHLSVFGDVTFGKGVSLKGTVIIIANHGERIDLPPGSALENKIVSGNLRIVNH